MPLSITDIAAAVVARLNGTAFGHPIAAERAYEVGFSIEDLAVLRCTVVMAGRANTNLDRSRQQVDYSVQVGIQQRLEPSSANYDPLVKLCEGIADEFIANPQLGDTGCRCVESLLEPVYIPDHVDEYRAFSGVVSLVFREWRDR